MSRIILGIDPGTNRIGFGLIKKEGNGFICLDYGVIEIPSLAPEKRLAILEKELSGLLARFHPEVVGVEKLFFSKNRKTALAVAEARGTILLGIAKAGGEIREFSPSLVKQRICGDGRADKKAMIKLVSLFLKLKTFDSLDDAADALAIAIVAATEPKND